jgi:tetratricopeptide (TPR) repeat protein
MGLLAGYPSIYRSSEVVMMFARAVGVASVVSLSWLLFGCSGNGGSGSDGLTLTQQYQAAMAEANPDTRALRLVAVARAQEDAGDASGAEQSLKDALAAASEIADDPYGKASAYADIAEMQGYCGLRGSAKDSVQIARDLQEEIENPKNRVAVLCKVSLTYGLYLEKPNAAKAYMDQAKDLVNNLKDPLDKVEGMMDLAQACQNMGNAEQADTMVTAAIDAAHAIERPRDRCDTITQVASRLVAMNQQEKAVARFEEAIAATESIETPESRAFALAEIGLAMGQSGMYDRAYALFDKASDLAYKEVTDTGLQAEITQTIDRYRGQLQ